MKNIICNCNRVYTNNIIIIFIYFVGYFYYIYIILFY